MSQENTPVAMPPPDPSRWPLRPRVVTRVLDAGFLSILAALLSVGIYYIPVVRGGGKETFSLIAGTWWVNLFVFGYVVGGPTLLVFLILCFIPRTRLGLRKTLRLSILTLLAITLVLGLMVGFGRPSPGAL